ncbi:MAG TPA: hypothetical protein VJY54_06315 [Lachnospiraceae bacterium]|nr:hypothetical protein [Lachnospiraceae bacterium]
MNRNKVKNITIRLLKFYVGLALIQLAVAAYLQIGIGSDSFTVFLQGVSKLFQLNVGLTNGLITFVLLIIVYIMDKKQFQIGMVLSVATAGLLLNAMTWFLNVILPANLPMWILCAEFAFACVLVAIGFPLMKSAELGVAPNDALYLAISNRTGKSYGMVRVIVDAIFLVVGFFLGGVVGVGTVVCVIALGPMVQFVMNHMIKQKEG